MELENCILSEVTRSQNDKHHIFSHMWILASDFSFHILNLEYT